MNLFHPSPPLSGLSPVEEVILVNYEVKIVVPACDPATTSLGDCYESYF